MNRTTLYITILLSTLIIAACSSEKAIKKGDQLAAINEYFDAAKQYKRAYSKIPSKERSKRGQIAWKMAECYRKSNNPQRAAGAYQNAIRYKYPDSITFRYLADAQVKNGDYKAAAKNYEIYLKYAPDDRMAQIGLKAAQQSMDWKKNPTRYIVKQAKELNGQRSDYCPAYIGEDTTMIIITSTRKEAKGEDISGITGQKPADMFMAKRDDKGKWQKVEKIESDINSEYEDGAAAFTPDGKTMYFTRCPIDDQYPRYASIYKSNRSDASWTTPEAVIISNDTLSSYAHPAVSPDGEWLYFTSDMAGGEGGLDLWRFYIGSSRAMEGITENLGNRINTEGDEQFPSFGPKGELFFSSNGYPGMGGLDIFCATQENDTVWKVTNMMAPINSNGDDFGITFAPGLYRGYFSSNRGDARGWDHIYSFLLPETAHYLYGWIYEKDGYELPEGVIYLIGNDGTNTNFGVMKDGSYSVRVTPGVEYVLLGTCKGYLNAMQELKTENVEGRREYQRDFALPSITRPVLIDNIFYEFDRAELTKESATSLDELVKLLNLNPNVTIELSSHCDFRGSDSYNRRLSQRRAEAVVNYLIEHGIEEERLTAVGYGEEMPKTVLKKLTETHTFLKENDVLTEDFINSLDNEEQQEICHQLNRRTEFRVLRTTYKLYE
ncbi:MAG: OmpA family protein [Bacteroidaceae bacterium]|nr:OmpA family protein [Bacteroidaceae bacterium]MBQ3539736.1 OmpA family protein [Bacteroidaceae bacterium]MBQ6693556.1 OmpA family protein [Bacteroidaceae bacterium]